FRSALGANTPLGERGHVMLLNPKAAHIFYASFHHLGRLETGPDNDINNAVSGTPNSAGSIPKGRYPLQVLKTVQQTADPAPVLIHGIAIVESPSLGVALSGSGVVENSVSYNVSGSHYVAHKGFEGGTFRNNMAIRSVGGIHLEGLVEMESLSQGGNGFWIGSSNVTMEGNLVSGARNAGIVYALELEMGKDERDDGSPVQSFEVESYEELQFPVHKQSTVYASRLGFVAFQVGSVKLQGIRTAFESLHCWSVGQGIHIERSQSLTFRDLVLIADPGAYHPSHPAMILQHGTRDIIFDRSRIEGFHTAHVSGDTVDGYDDHLEGIFIDTEVTGASQLWVNLDPEKVRFISGAELTLDRLMFSPEQNLQDVYQLPSQLERFSLRGHIHDSIGTVMFIAQFTQEALSEIIANGYYNCPKGGRCILLGEIIVDRRTNVAVQYRYLAKLPDNFSGKVGDLRGNAPVDLGIRRLIRSVDASSLARR
ncbi:MAG: hypothetical protein M3Q07_18855, partial [Pseudobdellovibrionaceae bacterium]|nr:hypothetical protein [Pseudobdellovibrionaceae bacterium]